LFFVSEMREMGRWAEPHPDESHERTPVLDHYRCVFHVMRRGHEFTTTRARKIQWQSSEFTSISGHDFIRPVRKMDPWPI
jgi:hypothetical protein